MGSIFMEKPVKFDSITMPIYSSPFLVNNVVRTPPSLPIAIKLGSLSVNLSFEDFPSATIEYEGIPESEIADFESAYRGQFSRKIVINGYPFRVAPDGGWNYEREKYLYQDEVKINVYKVTINLESWWLQLCEKPIKVKSLADPKTGKISLKAIASKADVNLSGPGVDIYIEPDADPETTMTLGEVLMDCARVKGCFVHYGKTVELRKLKLGGYYQFSWEEQISDGTNTLGMAPYYNGEELTWTKDEEAEAQEKEGQDTEEQDPAPSFAPKEQVIQTETETEEEVTRPPGNFKILRDLSSNFDKSGPTKTEKTTTTIDQKVDVEVVKTYGFMYLIRDGVYDQEDYWSIQNPEAFWKQVEETETRYIYTRVSDPIFRIDTPPDNTTVVNRVVIHPDYAQFAEVKMGNYVIFKLGHIEYLTEVVTTGWKMVRLISEEFGQDPNTYDLDPIYEPYVTWKKIAKNDRTAYLIKPLRADYQSDSAPYSIDWQLWGELSPDTQRRISSQTSIAVSNWGTDQNLKIGLLTPDLNYVEPYLAWVESRQNSSIVAAPDPESTVDDPLRPLINGEEGYYVSKWKKTNEEQSVQKTTEFQAQDAGFDNSAQRVAYNYVYGTPSEAEYRVRGWEQQEVQPNGNQPRPSQSPNQPKVEERVYVFSDGIPPWMSKNNPSGGSLSYPTARTQREAETAAETQLIVDTMNSTTQSRSLSFYFPKLEIGDNCNFESERFEGVSKVIGSSYTLRYDGSPNRFDIDVICTCEGTDVQLGIFEDRRITADKRRILIPPENEESTGGQQGEDGELSLGLANVGELGSVLPETVPGRRNYDFTK